MNLNVSEVFGPTIQGEGPHAGQRVAFVRLAGCNLSCSWCDTPYSWDWDRYDRRREVTQWSARALAEWVHDQAVPRIVVTGGEPMLQQKGLAQVVTFCPDVDFDIETNGTVRPNAGFSDWIDLFVVSPKLAHAGDPESRRLIDDALAWFALAAENGRAIWKFVVREPSDLNEVDHIGLIYGVERDHIWIMPEGATRDEHLSRFTPELVEAAIDHGYNVTSRLHVLAWGDRRGV